MSDEQRRLQPPQREEHGAIASELHTAWTALNRAFPPDVDANAQDARPRVAEVRVATELYGDEMQALQETLERVFDGPLELQVVLDPRILGGVWVRVGDTVLDGSLRGRIEALRHHLNARSRIILGNGYGAVGGLPAQEEDEER
jgi:hypothetical protein